MEKGPRRADARSPLMPVSAVFVSHFLLFLDGHKFLVFFFLLRVPFSKWRGEGGMKVKVNIGDTTFSVFVFLVFGFDSFSYPKENENF